MIKQSLRSRYIASVTAVLLFLIPSVALADTAATGSITGVMNASFNETLTIGDGTNSYGFVIRNLAGSFNGKCAIGGGSSYENQPCSNGDPTVIDIGGAGGMVEGTRAQRFVDAINATAIGVTASLNGDGVTVDLVNDTAGTAGNVDITETVSNESFVVTGMSGGAGGAGPVPEFSQIAYLLVLAFGGFYVVSKIKSSQAINR